MECWGYRMIFSARKSDRPSASTIVKPAAVPRGWIRALMNKSTCFGSSVLFPWCHSEPSCEVKNLASIPMRVISSTMDSPTETVVVSQASKRAEHHAHQNAREILHLAARFRMTRENVH